MEQEDNNIVLDQEPIVIKPEAAMDNPYKEKLTVGRIVANMLEFVWTVFKLAVLVTVVTVIAG